MFLIKINIFHSTLEMVCQTCDHAHCNDFPCTCDCIVCKLQNDPENSGCLKNCPLCGLNHIEGHELLREDNTCLCGCYLCSICEGECKCRCVSGCDPESNNCIICSCGDSSDACKGCGTEHHCFGGMGCQTKSPRPCTCPPNICICGMKRYPAPCRQDISSGWHY